ncbi:hypothetical protein N8987_01265 [Crocinitomix sp.]|nr:hypothetical protein [Crocinitomix sp.]
MRQIILILLASLTAANSFSQQIIYECGQNSGQNFDGWFFPSHQSFDAIEFSDYEAACFSEFGGEYAVTLTRKIDAMQSYKVLNLLFNFNVIDNAELLNVTYYTSLDGKRWNPINESRNNRAISVNNDSLNIKYVRATANARFERNGKISCNYAKIEGDKKTPSLDLLDVQESPIEEQFFIFNYKHTLNIETELELEYEVLITSISGQIVYREKLVGSNRIELPADLTGIFIVSIIEGNAFKASKRVLM